MMVDNPSQLPDVQKRQSIAEPYVKLEILCPKDFVGAVMELGNERRAEFQDLRWAIFEREREREREKEVPILTFADEDLFSCIADDDTKGT